MTTELDATYRLSAPLDEVMRARTSLVRLRPDPIDDETLLAILELANQATLKSHKSIEWIVLRDPDVKHQMARIYRQGWSIYRRLSRSASPDEIAARQWESDHFEDTPVLVVACIHGRRPALPVTAVRYYASALPAVQNLLLAARAVGLGATMTTLPVWEGWEARRTLGLPWHITPVAVVPLGWPRDEPTPANPRPVAESIHLDRFGQQPFLGRPLR